MYTTIELKQYVKEQIESKIGNVNWETIKFEEGNEKSVEGTYIFSKDNVYHVLFAEKGKVRDEKITTDEKDIIISVLDIVSFDIAMKFAIDNSYSEAMTAIGEFGIYVSTSSKTKYYSFENTHLDTTNNERYVIIDLGAAVSNNHQNDVFTTGAYLKVDGTTILSSQSTSGSIVSIVDDLYSDPSTRNSVIKLYIYLHTHD